MLETISDYINIKVTIILFQKKYPCKYILESNNFNFNNANIKFIKYHLSRFIWAYLNLNYYNMDQTLEYFNNVLNKLFIIHVPNINNIIKQVLPKNILKLENQVKH